MAVYDVWNPAIDSPIKGIFPVIADSSFEARQKIAAKHGADFTDYCARIVPIENAQARFDAYDMRTVRGTVQFFQWSLTGNGSIYEVAAQPTLGL